MDEYAEIRAQLEGRRGELRKRLDEIAQDLRRTNNPDFAEQAQEREHDEVLESLDDAGRAELAAILRALDRIDSGDYGFCVDCGQRIPTGRLEALPFSVCCVQCAD